MTKPTEDIRELFTVVQVFYSDAAEYVVWQFPLLILHRFGKYPRKAKELIITIDLKHSTARLVFSLFSTTASPDMTKFRNFMRSGRRVHLVN